MDKTTNQLEQVLIDTITKVSGGIDKGIDFAYQQIPDLIQQLLLFNLIWESITFVLLSAFFSALIYFNYRQYKWWNAPNKTNKYRTNWQENSAPAMLNMLQFFLFPLLAIWVYSFKNLLYIVLAPKLFLIEYVSTLVK